MPAGIPHGFDKNILPYIKLTPWKNGFIDEQTLESAMKHVNGGIKHINDFLKLTAKRNKTAQEQQEVKNYYNIFDKLNKEYYGSVLDTKKTVYIPITESFKMNTETDWESLNPFSAVAGSFGGAATMVGANIFGVNNVLGKVWAGSNIGIGQFSFSIAVDASQPIGNFNTALTQNKKYIDLLKELFIVTRAEGNQGVLHPPRVCQLTSSFGFSRKWIGIKNLDIETVGMWGSKENPIAYNVTLQVDDLVLGRKAESPEDSALNFAGIPQAPAGFL